MLSKVKQHMAVLRILATIIGLALTELEYAQDHILKRDAL